jgi:hypothetical protein
MLKNNPAMLQLNLSWAKVLAEQALACPSKVRCEAMVEDQASEVPLYQQRAAPGYGAGQAAQKLVHRLRCMELKDRQCCSSRDAFSKDVRSSSSSSCYPIKP